MNPVLPLNDSKATLLVAMELSLSKWVLAFAVAGQEKKRFKTVAGSDYAALQATLQEVKGYFRLAEETPAVFCYEAGRDGFYPYRQLTAAGHTVWVIDSASIEVSRRSRQAKSDGIDVNKLMELMQRQAEGKRKALQIVRVPDEAVEDQRTLPRERDTLLKDMGCLRNRIESLLFAQGYRDIPNRASALKTWLEQHQGLGSQLRERLERDVARLALLEQQFNQVEKTMREALKREEKNEIVRVAHVLMQLCGIGLIGAWVLASELFGWRKFRNRRQVGCVLGLAPTPYNSGSSEREQGISKAGNRRARSLLVELAWLWLRHQPDSALTQWFKKRFASGGKRMRRVGIVALARKLAVALWRYVDYGVLPEGAQLKAAKAKA